MFTRKPNGFCSINTYRDITDIICQITRCNKSSTDAVKWANGANYIFLRITN